MLLDWKSLIPKLGRSMKEFSDLSPSTMSGYRTLHAAGSETGRLDAKTRELISLAVAITTRCDGCIANHTKKAIELGTSREEIVEALGVAVAMNAGAALAYSGRVMDAFTVLSAKE